MTVKLLGPWGTQPAGTLYTTDATTEAAMISAKVATSDLTGGVVYVPPGGATAPAAGGAFLGQVASQAAMLALSAAQGAYCYRSDTATFWDCISTAAAGTIAGWSERGVDAASAQPFQFSGAGTYPVALGPGRVLGIHLSTSVNAGSVTVYDNTVASAPVVLATVSTVAGNNVSIPIGPPGVGAVVSTGIVLVVVGANVGALYYGES
ncbi:MAG: hypothetical protein RJA36_1601 [Pseudomonadota bacterium]|jgi:hypothetical protein